MLVSATAGLPAISVVKTNGTREREKKATFTVSHVILLLNVGGFSVMLPLTDNCFC